MSDDEDFGDTPPEACFFTQRAAFVPKISNEEFLSVAKALTETDENNRDFVDSKLKLQEKTRAAKKGKIKKSEALKKIGSDSGTVSVEDDSSSSSKDSISVAISDSPAVLTAAAKRRLKKQQEERAKELRQIEAANRKLLSAVDVSFKEVDEIDIDDSNDSDSKTVLTVSFLSERSRLLCDNHEKFSSIFPKVADIFHLKASEILLCVRDQTIKIDDTPSSLNISHNDIIECLPYKSNDQGVEDELEDKFKIFFQSANTKEKVELLVHKLEKMKEVMQRYADHTEVSVDTLSFEFDGDTIEGTETPQDLDMEAGNCIDVKFLEPVISAGTSTKQSEEDFEVLFDGISGESSSPGHKRTAENYADEVIIVDANDTGLQQIELECDNASKRFKSYTPQIISTAFELKQTAAPLNTENEFDIFGKHVAAQLKQLSTHQAIIALGDINDILTKCRLADLFGNTSNNQRNTTSSLPSSLGQAFAMLNNYYEQH